MRGIRSAGVGFAVATLSVSPALAQIPAPAATLGRAVPVDTPVIRAAYPDDPKAPTVTPIFPHGLFRNQATPPTGGTGGTQPGGTLPPPRPVDGPQPSITEQRGNPAAPGTPGAMMGVPAPSGTVPYAYPAPGYPNYIIPGSAGVVSGPVVVGPQACDPATAGGGSVVIPVTPSRPSVGFGQTVPSPAVRLEDPYWAGGAVNPLFPRVRAAVANTVFGERLTLGAEYLLWFARAQASPPLLTTSSPAFNGILGQGDTRVLYGDGVINNTRHSGARFSGVFKLNECWALDGNVWFLGRNGDTFTATSDQFPVLARPFFNVNANTNFAQVIASPGLSTGSAAVTNETSLWGAEANFRRAFLCGPCAKLDLLVGFRNFNLSESLQITEQFARTPNSNTGIGVPTAISGVAVDSFRTDNHFYGVNVGFAGEVRRGWWYLQGKAAVGLGSIYQQVAISGSQTINTTTGVQTAAGGLLALPGANLGTFSQTKFGVIPEVGLTVGLNLTPRFRVGVGYNFMYVNSVLRPADQIDSGLDVTRIPNFPINPTPAAISAIRPAVPYRTSDFFVQGINFSMTWTW